MSSVEERLKKLPEIAEEMNLTADEKLKNGILRASSASTRKRPAVQRLIPAFCALVVLVGGIAAGLPLLRGKGTPMTDEPLISAIAAGDPLPLGEQMALDVPPGSITIRSSSNPSYRSIWAPASGGNFPLIGVNGRYYRLLTNPTSISSAMLGEALGTVDNFTSEPALAGKNGICSNTVQSGETVYAVQGMKGAMAAANVNGVLRVFQRVSFGDAALVGSEALADTLKAGRVTALEISGIGTVNDPAKAQELIDLLTAKAGFLRSGAGESGCSLLIQLSNGLALQMAVNGDRLIACGTWACPEFIEAFKAAVQ